MSSFMLSADQRAAEFESRAEQNRTVDFAVSVNKGELIITQ